MEKRASCKVCSIPLPHHYLSLCAIYLTCKKHIRGLGKETHSMTYFPSKCCCTISFLDMLAYHHGYMAVAQFPPRWSKELQAAMHPEGFSVLVIPTFTFPCKPGCSRHLLLGGKSATRLEYFLSSSHACPLLLDRDLRSPLPPRQATLQLLKSSATSSTLPSCWHFSLSPSLERPSESKELLCLNPHLSLSKLGILYFH